MHIKARIFKSHQRVFTCKVVQNDEHHSPLVGELIEACALGNLLKHDENIVVGDYVHLKKDDTNHTFTIMDVLPRKNEIFRRLVREKKKKVTASNCDLLVIVSSVSEPKYKRGIVDRFILRAHQWGIKPILVFNKMDEYDAMSTADSDPVDLIFEEKRLEILGVQCFEICAKDALYKPRYLSLGFQDLQGILKDKTSIFLGQSGVGKSKAITHLTEIKKELLSREVGKVGKGTHTTTWSEIIEEGEYTIIDSPGIRSFGVDDVLESELNALFPDVEEMATRCKFSNCQHTDNAKGCYFQSLVPTELSNQLLMSRLESYLRLKSEIAAIPDYEKS